MLSISTSKKIIQLATQAHAGGDLKNPIDALLYLFNDDWKKRLGERAGRFEGKDAETARLEAVIVAGIDGLSVLRGRAAKSDTRPEIKSIVSNIEALDRIRPSKKSMPESPNLTFWRARVNLLCGRIEEAISGIEQSLRLIDEYQLKGSDILASKVTRYCSLSTAYLANENTKMAQKQAFMARDIALELTNSSDWKVSLEEYFLTHRFGSDPLPKAFFEICNTYVASGALDVDNPENRDQFNYYWDRFAASGGIQRLSPPDQFLFLTSEGWQKEKPNFLAEVAASLYLRLSDGIVEKASRRTELTLGAIFAMRKGAAGRIPIDAKWAAAVLLAMFLSASGTVTAGKAATDVIKELLQVSDVEFAPEELETVAIVMKSYSDDDLEVFIRTWQNYANDSQDANLIGTSNSMLYFASSGDTSSRLTSPLVL